MAPEVGEVEQPQKLNKGLELNELIWLFLWARCTEITLQ